jgi:hypothetical protein
MVEFLIGLVIGLALGAALLAVILALFAMRRPIDFDWEFGEPHR